MTRKEIVEKGTALLETLSEIPDWMAKAILDKAMREIEKSQVLQLELDRKFNAILSAEDGDLYVAHYEFGDLAKERRSMGDEEGSKVAMAYSIENLSRLLFSRKDPDSANLAIDALKIFKEIDDKEGMARIEKLMEEIKQSTKDEG